MEHGDKKVTDRGLNPTKEGRESTTPSRKRMLRRCLEYLRAFFWIPSEETRYQTVYSVRASGKVFYIRERQRLHFGRWGRWKWKSETRFIVQGVPSDYQHH